MRLTRQRRPAVTLIEMLFLVATLVGAGGGAEWGWRHYGWLGGLIGIPAGAVFGWLAFAALFFVLFAVIWVGATAYVLWTDGPREAWRFFRHGPRLAGQDDPPTAEEAERTRLR